MESVPFPDQRGESLRVPGVIARSSRNAGQCQTVRCRRFSFVRLRRSRNVPTILGMLEENDSPDGDPEETRPRHEKPSPLRGGEPSPLRGGGPIPSPAERPPVPTGKDTLRIIREDPDTAIGRLRSRILSGSADYRTWHNLAVALSNRGDTEGAIEAASTAVQKNPESAVSHLLLGMLYREADQFDEALESFDRIEQLDAQFPRLQANRGVVHFFRAEPDRAAEELSIAVRRDESDRIALFNLAVVEVARKSFPAAQSCFERLAALEPERAHYYHQFLVELGRVQMVEETLSQAHRIKNFMGIVGDRLRRFSEETHERLTVDDATELEAIRDDQEKIYSDMVVFLGAIRPRPMRLERIDLRALVERIVFVATTSGGGILIRRQYEDDLEPIQCDVDMLQEAFLNILLNAIDAVATRQAEESGPFEGEVRIELERHRFGDDDGSPGVEGVVIRFVDNGTGIAEGDLERVFTFGFTTKALGSGIGLAHTRKIISDHGGSIEIESAPGAGCTVRCALPLTPRLSENIVNLTIRSQLLLEPQELILEEGGEDLGI